MSATAAAHAEASTIRKAVWVTCAIVVRTCGPRGPHVRQAQHAADPRNYQRADVATELGNRTARTEVFVNDPDAFIARAVTAGADGSVDIIRDHETPWGPHRQGGFVDPYGHLWLVGDRTPLRRG